LQLVLSGNIYIPPLLAHTTQPQPIQQSAAAAAGDQPAHRSADRCAAPSVHRAVEQGNQRAAGIAEKTVKAHVAAIFKTLNVVNRTQAAHAVRAANLV
jgi:DNA-binding NarL/FixJ family response regulator